ncbi:retrovirus-related Pol polyprotein from transposon 297 [Trichonephila clavipes]|nr:retrovirus-related Pol polyprotein from transposon 297 [Trichonephila clavipes]
MNSEKRNTDTGHAVNQIETSISNQNNFSFNELQYVDIIVDNTPLRATLDSGANSVIINSKYVSEGKRIHSQILLTSCFGEKRSANVSEFTISLKGGEKKKILAAVCRIEAAILLPSKVFEFLNNESEEAGSTNASCKPVCLQNETGGENDVELTGGVTNSGKITDGSNLFLLKVSETFDEFLYDVSHISNSGIRDKVQTLIENYCPNKTETTALKMKIILSDEKPIAQRSRRLSLPEKKEVEKQIDEWLEQGIIRESCSDFSSPVVVCKKKDGTMRLCIDYRKLNKKIVKDRYPLPIIEEVLDKLGNGKIFTTLDLKNAFFHVDVDEASRKYTSFVTETGQYEFLKVPFGLSISSNYFQRYINYVFRELLRDGTLIIYLDDIIIPATDEKEACKKLVRVLETASIYGIELNLKKCQFLQGKINFLGHVIQNGIIQPSAEKTVSVCNFPEPKNAKDVQSFLGLTGYFRKYIPSYAMIARPLSDLLRGTNPFEFGHAQKIAFQNLKNALSNAPVLHLFKEGAKLELHTDACKLGLGAVLLQQGEDGHFYPIHYMSKKTSIQEEKLCSYELEVLAVIEALKKFRNYLLGRKFRIQTDCAAFAKTLDKKELSPKMARWSIFLTDFDYEVVHRPAKQTQHVDALSRHPVMLVTSDELTYKIVNAQESDEYIRTIKKLLQVGKTSEFIVSCKSIRFHHGALGNVKALVHIIVQMVRQAVVIQVPEMRQYFQIDCKKSQLFKNFPLIRALDDNQASVSLGQLTKLAPDAEIQVFERHRSGQVAFQAEPFVNVTISPSVFVCREEVGVIHRDTNHLGLCAILRYAGNGQFDRNRLTTMVKYVSMGKKR